jgi:hypothetical protein
MEALPLPRPAEAFQRPVSPGEIQAMCARSLGPRTVAVHAAELLIHGVRGELFGPVAGPWFGTWGEALIAYFTDLAADLSHAGLDSADVRQVTAAATRDRAVLDEVTRLAGARRRRSRA